VGATTAFGEVQAEHASTNRTPAIAFALSTSTDHKQPVVQLHRRTENGEAPGWQGTTTENIGNI
jgi:hypothetical protein